MKKFSVSTLVPPKAAAAVAGAVATVTGASAFAANEISAALTDAIDKSDLWAGGAVILGACAVVAMIGLGRRLAR